MAENSELLVASVDFIRLIESRLPMLKLAESTVNENGLVYHFEGSKPNERLFAVIAVYADEKLASDAFEYQISRTSVGPSETARSTHRDLASWKTEDPAYGTLLLRRANVVLTFFGGGIPWDVRTHLIEEIDEVLEKGGPEVIHAEKIIPPEIVSVKLPSQIARGSRVEAEIEVANILPAEARFGSNSSSILFSEGSKPTLAYYAPYKPTHESLVLVISTPGNLLSKKTISVDVQ